jgi:predicted RNA binding protein YcfA (HicA-like mRNA interferase family)
MAHKEIEVVRRRLSALGYRTERRRGNHYQVLKPDGEAVRLDSGQPVMLPGTPSDSRTMENLEAQLKQAGIDLKQTPTKKGPAKERRSNILRKQLLSEMEAFNLAQSDVWKLADRLAAAEGRPCPSQPAGMVSEFLKGTSLRDLGYNWLRAAVVAIDAAQGIPAEAPPPAPEPLSPEPPDEPPEPPGVEVEGESTARPVRLPKLAIELMRWIYAQEKDDDRIEQLINEIATLELRR